MSATLVATRPLASQSPIAKKASRPNLPAVNPGHPPLVDAQPEAAHSALAEASRTPEQAPDGFSLARDFSKLLPQPEHGPQPQPKPKPDPSAPSLQSLEQRIAAQQRQINWALQKGTLTKDEATALFAKLEDVQKRAENDAGDGNGLSRGADYASELKATGEEIKKADGDDAFDPAKLLTNVDALIRAGTANGSLTDQEAVALKEKSRLLRDALSSGNYDPSVVGSMVRDLRTEVCKESTDGEISGEKRLESFERQIQSGLTRGALSQSEADALRRQLSSIDPKSADAKTINEMKGAVESALFNAQGHAGRLSKSLATAIDRAEKSGRLTPDEVSSLRAQLTQIGASSKVDDATVAKLNALGQELRFLAQT
jgi:hypothetical protein